jgi:hypothetical protein
VARSNTSESLRPSDRRVFCQPIDTSLGFFNVRRRLAGGLQHADNSMPHIGFGSGDTVYPGRLYYIRRASILYSLE